MLPPVMYHVTVSKKSPFGKFSDSALVYNWEILTQFASLTAPDMEGKAIPARKQMLKLC